MHAATPLAAMVVAPNYGAGYPFAGDRRGGMVIDWRMSADPELADALLSDVPAGWLRFASRSP